TGLGRRLRPRPTRHERSCGGGRGKAKDVAKNVASAHGHPSKRSLAIASIVAVARAIRTALITRCPLRARSGCRTIVVTGANLLLACCGLALRASGLMEHGRSL